jgi:hypothetical protein
VNECSKNACSVRCLSASAARAAKSWVCSAETADATASDPINAYDLTRIRPLFYLPNKPRANRIVQNVSPFFGVTLAATQQMIVESGLPKGNESLTGDTRQIAMLSKQYFLETPLQSFDPVTHLHLTSRAEAGEQMDVIWHDYVATNANSELLRPDAVVDERAVQFGISEKPLPKMRVECDEEHWRIEALVDWHKPRRLLLKDSLHHRCCSVRCPQRTRTKASPRSQKSAEDSGRYSAAGMWHAEGVRT